MNCPCHKDLDFFIQRLDLSDDDAKSHILDGDLRMDYVNGRALKINLIMRDGKLTAPDFWYDHTDEQYDQLLSQFNISREKKPDHGTACNCEKCTPNSDTRDPDKVFEEMVHEPAIKEAWNNKKAWDKSGLRPPPPDNSPK